MHAEFEGNQEQKQAELLEEIEKWDVMAETSSILTWISESPSKQI